MPTDLTDFQSFAYAQALDAADPLAHLRTRFAHPDPTLVYADGNSLGRLPLATVALAQDLVQRQWGDRLIRSWNEGWFDAPERIGAKIARLIGAQPDEVIVADSTSVNLFKLLVAALRHAQTAGPAPRRTPLRVVTDDLNFPSDLYIAQQALQLLDPAGQLVVTQSADGIHGPVAELAQALQAQPSAVLTLSHTVFKSGYTYDLAALTAVAHDAGALVLWDLSHSAGALPVDLNGAGADLAIGCTYKYLNGGPGAPAFLYVRRDLQAVLLNPIAGWMGQQRLFDFDLAYTPAAGLRRFLSGTPPMLSLAMIEPGVDLVLEAGSDALRAKSLQQTEYLIALWAAWLAPLGFALNSPRTPSRRGSHVSFGHPAGLAIDQALIHDCNVIPDFRQPDNLRIGIAPLYTSFADVWTIADRLRNVVAGGLHTRYSSQQGVVT